MTSPDPHRGSGEVNYCSKLSEKDKEIQFQKLLGNLSSPFTGPDGTTSPGLNQLRWPRNVVLLIKIVQNHVQGFNQLSPKHMDLARRGVGDWIQAGPFTKVAVGEITTIPTPMMTTITTANIYETLPCRRAV